MRYIMAKQIATTWHKAPNHLFIYYYKQNVPTAHKTDPITFCICFPTSVKILNSIIVKTYK